MNNTAKAALAILRDIAREQRNTTKSMVFIAIANTLEQEIDRLELVCHKCVNELAKAKEK